MRLGCAEFAVPGETLREKLNFLEQKKLWLELANDGKKSLVDVKSLLSSYKVEVRSVQAYRQHEFQLLAAGEKEREMARKHVAETINFAGEIGAEHAVVVTGYGGPGVEAPERVLAELLKEFSGAGEERGVKVGLEALGAKTSFLPRVDEVATFLKRLSLANVGIVLDTMHAYSAGENPAEIFERNSPIITEVQLRDVGSRAPGKGEIDFKKLGKLLRDYSGLLCLEYHPVENPEKELMEATSFIGEVISGAR
ncbi:MAG: sugar phosphate isomerase/epimerase family protein [Candidatus Hadarchaeales archaeon]